MSFMKKEMLTSMQAMDDLLEANSFNIEIMATVPFLLMSGLTYSTLQYVYRRATSRKGKRETFVKAQLLLRDIAMVINQQQQIEERVQRKEDHRERARIVRQLLGISLNEGGHREKHLH